ncbi:DNA-methyltransferase [Melioribacter sp. OK-6-Me]|uniref:DNA-methyltransferase n=1 Tax=unclassified Melioribacter TaxID=2627329 RepID=UPI003EDB2968
MKAGQKAKSRNKTIILHDDELNGYSKKLLKLNSKVEADSLINKTINQDFFDAVKFMPDNFVDLLILDPPYNLNKSFNSIKFTSRSIDKYAAWIEKIIIALKPLLKKNASLYFCSDWYTSISISSVLSKHFIIRNRITWEREKGRGSVKNWKNNSEDIWFCTMSDKYKFNVNAVKLIKKVIAPYRDSNGLPKDWIEFENGNFRLTHPSNLWTDISIPFWSMSENTEHPTQKPEKLIAKLILASSEVNDIVFDPFVGSGTTSVVAKKLGRKYVGIEADNYFACLTEKRLELAETNSDIQGYNYGFFWERNTKPFPINFNVKKKR